MSEINQNPMPKFEIVPNPLRTVKEVGRKALDFLFHLHDTPLHYSNHYRGAEEMLASVEPTPVQGRLEFTSWDDQGRYIEVER